MPSRVRRWLRTRALQEISPRANAMGGKLGRKPARISMRDTRSRWGSCSREGNLNFSWRLVMAPENVLNYVVAHEVAHLRELNHSDRFWALVDTLAQMWVKPAAGCAPTEQNCTLRPGTLREKPVMVRLALPSLLPGCDSPTECSADNRKSRGDGHNVCPRKRPNAAPIGNVCSTRGASDGCTEFKDRFTLLARDFIDV